MKRSMLSIYYLLVYKAESFKWTIVTQIFQGPILRDPEPTPPDLRTRLRIFELLIGYFTHMINNEVLCCALPMFCCTFVWMKRNFGKFHHYVMRHLRLE
jgi:hypothetical protein